MAYYKRNLSLSLQAGKLIIEVPADLVTDEGNFLVYR
jgi:hypothetical protein